jgi:hypothetical protein
MVTLDEYGRKQVWLISRQELSICWEAEENHENHNQNTISRISRAGNFQNT